MSRPSALVVACIGLMATGCAPLLCSPSARTIAALRSAYPAQAIGRWDNVMRLPSGAPVEVLASSGALRTGRIVSANIDALRISEAGVELEMPRTDVVRVDLLRHQGSDTAAVVRSGAAGAAQGAAGMVLLGLIFGGRLSPPPGRLLAAGAASGAFGGAQAALVRRQPQIIYLSPAHASPAYRVTPQSRR